MGHVICKTCEQLAQLRRELEEAIYERINTVAMCSQLEIELDTERKRADLNERAGRLILEELEYHKDRERISENTTFDYFRKLAELNKK